MNPLVKFANPGFATIVLLLFTSFINGCKNQTWGDIKSGAANVNGPITYQGSTTIQLSPPVIVSASSMLTGLNWAPATVSAGDRIITPFEYYDPLSSAWAPLNGSPADSAVGQVILQNGDLLYVATGPYGTFPKETYILSPSTLTWRRVGDLIVGQHYPLMRVLNDGKVIVIDGQIATGSSSSTVEIYDPQTEIWTAKASLNVARNHPSIEVLDNGKVLVCGGGDGVTSTKLTSCELYDPTSNTWSFTGSMTRGRQYSDFIKLNDGRILAACGDLTNPPHVTTQTELYDHLTGLWSLTGTLNVARTYCAISKLRDGRVMVAGGYDWIVSWDEKLDSIEIFNPQLGLWELSTLKLTYKKTDKPKILELSDGRIFVAGGSADIVGDVSVDIINNVVEEIELDPNGGDGNYTYQLLSGPGKISGNKYFFGVAGTATIRIQDTSGNELDVMFTILP